MLAIERRKAIVRKLQAERKVVVKDLSRDYQVSEETIRRDLDKLEQEGLVVKSYGGAVLKSQENTELPYNIRKESNVAGKEKIARIVSGMVRDGESLILDASTTVNGIVKALEEKQNLTIITNSVEVLLELFEKETWTLLLAGGQVKPGAFAVSGPQTDRMIRAYHADTAILSCMGMSRAQGPMDADETFVSNKQSMIASAKETLLVVDHTKFGKPAFAQVADWEDITAVVTDEKPDAQWLATFQSAGVTCYYPE